MSMTIRKATHTIENVELIAQKIIPNSQKEVTGVLSKVRGKTHKEICQKLYQYCKLNFKYENDKPGFEEIRSPAQTIKDRKADCEDYAIFISACLLEMNYPVTLRIVDYGDGFGWSHIYVVSKDIIIDPVNKTFNAEIKPKKKRDFEVVNQSLSLGRINNKPMKTKQLEISFKNGLGKLPQTLISDRERFILTLWSYFVENGATYNIENEYKDYSKQYSKGYQNTLPNNITDLSELVKILRSNKFGVNAELIEGNEKVKIPDTIRISFDKQSFKFDPYYLADSVFRVYGNDGLSPKKKSGDSEISPYNQKLMELFKPFVTTDKYDTRPAMKGISFSADGVCATDGYMIAWLQTKTNYTQIFNFKGDIINERFPAYQSVIPQNYTDTVTVKTDEIKAALLQSLKYANKVTNQVVFAINPDNDGGSVKIFSSDIDKDNGVELGVNSQNNCPPKILGINAKFFLKIVTTLEKLKVKEFTFFSSEYNRAITTTVKSEYGNFLFLIMPVMIADNNEVYSEYIRKFNERLKMLEKYRNQTAPATDQNKAFIMAKAKAKLRLLALKF